MSHNVILLDGAIGTSLWNKATNKVPVWRYNIENPKIVRELHEEYIDAGAQLIQANTFAANGPEVSRDSSYSVEQVVRTAVKIAKDVVDKRRSENGGLKLVLAAGPLTGLLKPFGRIEHQTAKDIYEEMIGAGMEEHPDVILLETFMDLEMLKIAARAAKAYDIPVMCSMSFMGANKNGKRPPVAITMMGNKVVQIVKEMTELGVNAVGLNCSMGPIDALPVVEEFVAATDLPVIFKPNAGKPLLSAAGAPAGASFDVEAFANDVLPAVDKGATYIGGCCGSDPMYIKRLAEKLREKLAAEA